MFRFIAAGTCCVLRPCVRRRMLAIISGCFGLPRPVFCGMLVELLEYLWEGLRLIKFSVCLRAFVCVCVSVSVCVCERERECVSVIVYSVLCCVVCVCVS